MSAVITRDERVSGVKIKLTPDSMGDNVTSVVLVYP
jgi:mRNA-degrading endonuclease toxin of MazEF toxin-antitoxin module